MIRGASAYSPAQLFAAYRDQLGRPISSASAQAIIAQLEAMYLHDGYSRPVFSFDDGLSRSGVLRIEIFEAQVSAVELSGEAGPYADKLEQLAQELRLQAPLRTAQLQASLQKMRELPGLTVHATTRADQIRRNSYVLAVRTEFQLLSGMMQLTNRGTRDIGPDFGFTQLVGNNLLGREERLGALLSMAADAGEYHGHGLFVDLPVAAGGTRLSATTFTSRSAPSGRPDRDERYLRERTALRVATPIDTGERFKMSLAGGLDFDDLEIILDGERLRSEQLRVAELGARLSGNAGRNQYFAALQARQGLSAFGSALQARDLADDPRREDFLLLRAQYTQLLRFDARWSVRLDALGQHSAYVLPDSERYKIGGERLGRGFEVAHIAGDRGIGAKVELRRELAPPAPLLDKASIYGFYDFAAAWKQDLPGRESASTAGIGMALEYRRVSGSLEVARPLSGVDVEGDTGTKIFAELRLKL